MKFTTISDVHIKNAIDCPNYKRFLIFLNSEQVSQSDKVFLLGDIFDILVGNHKEYILEYAEVFNKLKQLSRAGKEIYYIEGNHDFHITKLLNDFAKENSLDKFYANKKPFLMKNVDRLFYFGHGDEIEIDNLGYRIYTLFIRSFFMAMVSNYIFTYSFIKKLGQWASGTSRERNEKKYTQHFNNDHIKEKFRKSIEIAHRKYQANVYFCGHSHVFDNYTSINSFSYFNNGYFPIEKSFFFFNGSDIEVVKI